MKNKSIIIMTILSLVLIVGCCYRQHKTMAPNVTQGEVDDKKDTKTVKTKDYMYYCIRDSIYKVNVHTKEKSLVYKNENAGWFYDFNVKDGWIYCVMALLKMNLKDNSKTLVKKDIIYKILDVNGDKLLFLGSYIYTDKDKCYSDGVFLSGMDFKDEVCLGGYFTP